LLNLLSLDIYNVFTAIFWLYSFVFGNCQLPSIDFIITFSIIAIHFQIVRAVANSLKMFCSCFIFGMKAVISDLLSNYVRMTFLLLGALLSLTLKRTVCLYIFFKKVLDKLLAYYLKPSD